MFDQSKILQWLDWWITWVFGVVAGWLVLKFNSFKKRNKVMKAEQDAIKDGVEGLLRDRIIQGYNYCIDKEYCSVATGDNLYNLYAKYSKLYSDGEDKVDVTLESMMQELKSLPKSRKDKVQQE